MSSGRKDQEIINWLSPLNFSAKQKDAFSRRAEGTGEWILEEKLFREWQDGANKVLWCPGIRMALSLISAFIFLYHDHTDEHKRVLVKPS
jgi:hypothetical protein